MSYQYALSKIDHGLPCCPHYFSQFVGARIEITASGRAALAQDKIEQFSIRPLPSFPCPDLAYLAHRFRVDGDADSTGAP